jgi:hypothetical protein
MSLDEYRARQMANEARNQGAQSSLDVTRRQPIIRDIRAHVEKAFALLDEESKSRARARTATARRTS